MIGFGAFVGASFRYSSTGFLLVLWGCEEEEREG
jgi:hypothetical protein